MEATCAASSRSHIHGPRTQSPERSLLHSGSTRARSDRRIQERIEPAHLQPSDESRLCDRRSESHCQRDLRGTRGRARASDRRMRHQAEQHMPATVGNRRLARMKVVSPKMKNPGNPGVFSLPSESFGSVYGVPKGIRTPVTAVKRRCPGPLDDGDAETRAVKAGRMVEPVGIEPTTSTMPLSRSPS